MAPDRLCCDEMLGRLARYLRICGHDTAYTLDRGVEADDAVLALVGSEDRRLLTRDRALARRADDPLLLESTAIEDQLAACGAAGIGLTPRVERCSVCNGVLERLPSDPAPGDGPRDRSPGEGAPEEAPDPPTSPALDGAPDPATTPVWRCPDCGQLFWQGSHWDDIEETLAAIRERVAAGVEASGETGDGDGDGGGDGG